MYSLVSILSSQENSIGSASAHKRASYKQNNMVMQFRGDKCYSGRGKWQKIPLLPGNEPSETLERVTTVRVVQILMYAYVKTEEFQCW